MRTRAAACRPSWRNIAPPKASWQAAEVFLQTHGGLGFAKEYDIERKVREIRLFQVAPILTNLIYAYIAEHVLGLPRSH
jgi:acyl-CoA dehydrogenase